MNLALLVAAAETAGVAAEGAPEALGVGNGLQILSWADLAHALLCLVVAAVLGALLAFRPRRAGGPPRVAHVTQAQIMMAIVGSLVMLIVGASLARAFAIAGTAGLVRYRAKIDDPKDASVMLSCLAIGLASGVGLLYLATAGAVFIVGVLWVLEWREPWPAEALRAQGLGQGPGRAEGGGGGPPHQAPHQVRAPRVDGDAHRVLGPGAAGQADRPDLGSDRGPARSPGRRGGLGREEGTEMSLIVEPDDGIGPIVSAINKAKTSIDIGIFRLDRADVAKALRAAVARGVPVRTLIAHTNRGGDKRLRKLEQDLLKTGASVRRTDDDLHRYHNKIMIVDRATLYVLGFNYTALDVDKSRSFGLVTKKRDLVQEAIKLFEADSLRQPYRPARRRSS